MTGWVTPELAKMFGWIRDEEAATKYYRSHNEADDGRSFWHPPRPCPFFVERPERGDDGEDPPPPPDPDPNQLTLILDPSEDLAKLDLEIPEPERVAV